MDKKVINQPVKSSRPDGKRKKSSIPGVTIIEFTENIPQGCSGPDFERRPIPLTIQEGKNANFKTVVRGNPKPTVVWTFKEEVLSNGNRYKIYYDMIMDEYILQIKQLIPDDAGSYKCTVSNEYGEAKCIANLNIIEVGFKKKLKRPGEVQDKNTDPTDFRKMLKKCAPSAKKEEKITNSKIWEILMHADKKDYERIAMEYGLTDFRGMLTKLKQMKIEAEEKQAAYVESISNLKRVEVKSSGSASFGFDMELKHPSLKIYLYKDEKLVPLSLDENNKHHLKQLGKRYTFCIKDLQLDDVGLYKVNVEDATVFATEVDISLIPIEFKRRLQEVKCKESEDAVFECTISLPLPVEWEFKKISLNNSDKYQIKVSPDGLTHCMIVKDVHPVDKGVYTISAGAGSSNAYLIVEKSLESLDSTSLPLRCKKMPKDSEHSQEDSFDVNLKQGLDDTKKEGLKGTMDSSLHDKDSMTKDDLKGKKDFSSEDDSTKFGRGGLLNSSRDGLDGATKNGRGGYDRMGKDGSGSLNGVGKDGFVGLDGMGKDGKGLLDGMGKDGKGRLDGMGKDGKGRLDGMGKDGKGGLDGMGKDGKGQLDGMGKDGKGGLDGMGKDGKGLLDGMGKDGKGGLDGMGKDGKGRLDGMGKDGKGGLDGMGKDGKGQLDGMGKDGKGGLDGMGKDGKGRLDGMGKDGKGGLDGMGKDGKGRLDGMGKDGKCGLDGMGKDGKGQLDGMGKDGKGGLDGMGKDGKGRLDGMGKDGKGGLDGMGKDGKGRLDGMGKDGKGGLDGMGKDGKGRLDGMGKDGKGGLDGMGKDGKGQLDGMGKDGKGRLDGMGKDGRDGMDGMGKDGKGRLDGMGNDGKGRLDGMGKDGRDGMDGMGKDGKGRLDGMGKDGRDGMDGSGLNNLAGLDSSGKGGRNGLDTSGSRGMQNNLADGSNRDKDGLTGHGDSTGAGTGDKGKLGLNDIDGLSMGGGLSNMSGSDGSAKGGCALTLGNQKGLLGEDQMSIQNESMAGGKQDSSRRQQSGSARRRKGKLSESDISELTADGNLRNKEPTRRFQSGLSDVSARKGEAAELCCVMVNEKSEGTWFKNGKKITSGDGKIITKEGAVQTLTLQSVQEEDSGMYTFEADGGKTEASLFVEDPPEFGQDVLDQLGKKLLVKAGHTATVKVPVSGKPPIKVSWYKDGDELFEDNRISIDNSGNFTRLSISNCNRKDSGKLTIKLKNESGIASANISLAVTDKPQVPQGPVEVLESSESHISFKWKPPKDDGGKPIERYIVERQQVGRNTWTKVDEVDKSTTTFCFDKVEHGKNYKFKVWAVNSEGVSEALVSDTVTAGRKAVPGALAKPNILNASSKSITLAWTPPHNTGSSKIIGYIVEKRKKGSNTWNTVNDTPITAKKCTVTDVIAGLEYEFRVIAVNSSGPGEPSCESEAVFAREPIKPPGNVRDLRVTDSTYSTISLAWTPPICEGNNVPKGYIIEMKSSGSTTWIRCNDVTVGMSSYTVKGLKKMEMHFLRVRAINDGGMGEPIELDNYVLAMPPPVCPKFILDGTVKSYMIIKEGNSIRVQMPFQASPPPEVIWLKDGLPLLKQATVTSTGDGTQLFIPIAQRSDSGIYSITLKNFYGQETFSFEIRATAIPKSPGPVTLNENVPNTVTVSWEPSRDEPHDNHLHYVVMKRDSSRVKWHTVGNNIFNNKFTVINVVPGCKYYFRVLAKNDMGYSESSDTREPWCISKQRDPITLKLPNYKALNNTRAPEFSVKLKSHIAPSGSDINMTCAVKGSPPPKVSWCKNNINIMDDANFWSTNVCGVCSLCIFDASPKETGEYTAIAENSVGRAACSTRLTVRE
uniref:immunoglobulin-like and fibronectin type III domain-containing protein 1.1 n=1 Tax=Pristiophorus japonicus TaxID=55135 RepID=UPI00398F2372